MVLPRNVGQSEWDWLSSETVKTVLGVVPKNVPTYLALNGPNQTMGLLRRLAKLEFDGLAVDVEGIEEIRQRLVKQGARLRAKICSMVGKVFDCESEQEELTEIFREVPSLRGHIGLRKVTLSRLEQLAVTEPVVRLIVEFKRVRRKVVRLESISGAARGGKVYPLFNQIRSRTGLVAANAPSLFDIEGLRELKSYIDDGAQDLLVDTRRALATWRN